LTTRIERSRARPPRGGTGPTHVLIEIIYS